MNVREQWSEEIMESLMMRWISYFGAPKKISDRWREFQNEEMEGFSEKFGIELRCMASESPWRNGEWEGGGLIERNLRKLKEEGVKKKE